MAESPKLTVPRQTSNDGSIRIAQMLTEKENRNSNQPLRMGSKDSQRITGYHGLMKTCSTGHMAGDGAAKSAVGWRRKPLQHGQHSLNNKPPLRFLGVTGSAWPQGMFYN